MMSRGAQRIVIRSQERRAERSRGTGQSVIRVAAGRAADLAFGDIRKLPVQINTTALQNEAGQFLFLEGYSMPGGPDVVV